MENGTDEFKDVPVHVMGTEGGDSRAVAARGSGALAKTDQQRAIAEVQAAMVIARMNPRDPIRAMDKIRNACCRAALAESAIYTYARGGTNISGPSIRLAEVIAQNWGNIQFGIRELEQRGNESTVQAYAWDVETNTRKEVTFQVPHIRFTKMGKKGLDDPRDIYEMVANMGARRLRGCILSIIPGDVTEVAVAQCEETVKAKVDISSKSIEKLVTAFAGLGVSKIQIEKRIQRHIEAIQPAQIIGLRKIYTSLKDGMSSIKDWFEQEPKETTADESQPPIEEAPAEENNELEEQPETEVETQVAADAEAEALLAFRNQVQKKLERLIHTEKGGRTAGQLRSAWVFQATDRRFNFLSKVENMDLLIELDKKLDGELTVKPQGKANMNDLAKLQHRLTELLAKKFKHPVSRFDWMRQKSQGLFGKPEDCADTGWLQDIIKVLEANPNA